MVCWVPEWGIPPRQISGSVTPMGPHGLRFPEAGEVAMGSGQGPAPSPPAFTLMCCSWATLASSRAAVGSLWAPLRADFLHRGGFEPFHPGNVPWEPSGAPSSSHGLGTGFCCRYGVRSGHTARPLPVLWQRELQCPCRDRAEVAVPGGSWELHPSSLPVLLLTLSSCGMLGEAGSGVTPTPAPGQSLPCCSELAEPTVLPRAGISLW